MESADRMDYDEVVRAGIPIKAEGKELTIRRVLHCGAGLEFRIMIA